MLGGGARCAKRSGRGGEERGSEDERGGVGWGRAHFIGPGRWWGGGEAAGGGGVLIAVGFEGVKGEEETGRHRFSGGA
jgi:hypothetical protein